MSCQCSTCYGTLCNHLIISYLARTVKIHLCINIDRSQLLRRWCNSTISKGNRGSCQWVITSHTKRYTAITGHRFEIRRYFVDHVGDGNRQQLEGEGLLHWSWQNARCCDRHFSS